MGCNNSHSIPVVETGEDGDDKGSPGRAQAEANANANTTTTILDAIGDKFEESCDGSTAGDKSKNHGQRNSVLEHGRPASNSDWVCFVDPATNMPYYYSAVEGRTTWTPPPKKDIMSYTSAIDQGEGTLRTLGSASACGWLLKKGGISKQWQRRYIVLQDGTLHYYKRKPAGESAHQDNPEKVLPTGTLDMSTVLEVILSRDKAQRKDIILRTAVRDWKFALETPADAQWTDIFHAATVAAAPLASNDRGGAGDVEPVVQKEESGHGEEETDNAASTLSIRGKTSACGWLLKKGAISGIWQKRWVDVDNGVLKYFDTLPTSPRDEPNGSLPMADVVEVLLSRDKTERKDIILRTDSRDWKFAFESQADSRWFDIFHNSITEYEDDFDDINIYFRDSKVSAAKPLPGTFGDSSVVIVDDSEGGGARGWMLKKGLKSSMWQRRFFVLSFSKGTLVYYRKDPGITGPVVTAGNDDAMRDHLAVTTKPAGTINVSDVEQVEILWGQHTDERKDVIIHTALRDYKLAFEMYEDAEPWIKQFQFMIDKATKAALKKKDEEKDKDKRTGKVKGKGKGKETTHKMNKMMKGAQHSDGNSPKKNVGNKGIVTDEKVKSGPNKAEKAVINDKSISVSITSQCNTPSTGVGDVTASKIVAQQDEADAASPDSNKGRSAPSASEEYADTQARAIAAALKAATAAVQDESRQSARVEKGTVAALKNILSNQNGFAANLGGRPLPAASVAKSSSSGTNKASATEADNLTLSRPTGPRGVKKRRRKKTKKTKKKAANQ